jgi:hypothetical protein
MASALQVAGSVAFCRLASVHGSEPILPSQPALYPLMWLAAFLCRCIPIHEYRRRRDAEDLGIKLVEQRCGVA